jgi:hypothetical protein
MTAFPVTGADPLAVPIPPGYRLPDPDTACSLRPPTAYRSALAITPVSATARSAWSYEVATLDAGGRFYPRDAIEQLHWAAHGTVQMRLKPRRVHVSESSTNSGTSTGIGLVVLDGRGRLRLPTAMRAWIGVDAGSRVLIGTNACTRSILILAARVLDTLVTGATG